MSCYYAISAEGRIKTSVGIAPLLAQPTLAIVLDYNTVCRTGNTELRDHTPAGPKGGVESAIGIAGG